VRESCAVIAGACWKQRAGGVRRVRIFGSLARGESGPASDVDLLVELAPGDRHDPRAHRAIDRRLSS
jgi:predicted nucleotidyltransferase